MTATATPPLIAEVVGLDHRDYQDVGTRFLHSRKRGMITDAPGLGKTPQAALASEVPVMVVAPTYLTKQWFKWLQTHLPNRKVARAVGNRFERTDIIHDETLDFLIVNTDMCRTHKDTLVKAAERFNTVIFDESHHLRNRTAGHSQGAAAIALVVERVYELTATPIWKEVDDLYMQLHILYPQIFNSYWDFVDKWCLADSSRYSTKITGIKKEMIKELEEDILSVIRIGRTYIDAGRELPEVIPNEIEIDFSEQMRKIYDETKEMYRLQILNEPERIMTSAMEVMHVLRQLTASAKTDSIKETIEDTAEYVQDRYIVFTWYKDTAYNLSTALDALPITGDYTPDERAERAQQGKPLVATISSLSEGVDLSHMRMVIFAEEHWPPGSEVQALARVRRERLTESNEEPILLYYALVGDSIDTTIHTITRQRSATIKDILKEALGLYM